MSADNWGVCPRCLMRRGIEINKRASEVQAAYGNVHIEEFESLRAELDTFAAEPDPTSLREDYEFWMSDNGQFSAVYSARCQKCNWGHEFKHTEQVDVNA